MDHTRTATTHTTLALTALLSAALSTTAAEAATTTPPPARKTILDTRGLWRARIVWETDETMLRNGTVGHYFFAAPSRDTYHQWRKRATITNLVPKRINVVRLPATTSPHWMRPDFDDSTWVRCRAPLFANDPRGRKGGWGSPNPHWKLLLLRGRFEVTDPAKAGDLRLSLVFRGGVVVYLNGEELTRAYMPEGPVGLYTNALPYPEEVYLLPKGTLISTFDHRVRGGTERMRRRFRRVNGFRIPASRLRRGVNVLAVAIHRAPAHWKYYATRVRPFAYGVYDERARARWARMALWQIQLDAPAGAAVVPNVGPARGRRFLAWNHSTMRRVHSTDYADPHEPLRPIRISGVPNGAFCGQIVIGGDKAITGLRAWVSDLKGPWLIPASAIQVLYGVPDGTYGYRARGDPWFDTLDEVPPPKVRVYRGAAAQPIWIKVSVPGRAAPGDYSGKVVVSADGVEPIEVPLKLRVIDWTLPPPPKYTGYIDFFQSPDSLAIEYKTPFWSRRHWELIDKSFSLLGRMGLKTLYITCVRRTHLGNEHAMARWTRGPKGELVPELSLVEKYLDVATRHVGKVPAVILYAWEPPTSMGHAGVGPSRTHDRKILITVVDRATGKLEKAEGPKWGTPECRAFWKKLTVAMRDVLRKRGLGKSMLFGLLGDHRPTKQAMSDISNAMPKVKWAVQSHFYCDSWQGFEMGMCVAMWGVRCKPVEPERGRGYGWKNPFWLSYYPREMHTSSPLVEYRTKIERQLSSMPLSVQRWPKTHGIRGIGRLGAEFWKVLRDRHGRRRSSLAARYPETYWGQLCLNYGVPYILGPGKRGPVPTVRYEAFRENMQEIEGRVFIEKALLDKTAKAKLGEGLARRCRDTLDERIRVCLRSPGEGWVWFVSSDWEQRTERLFRLASEVEKRLGTRK